MELAHPFAMTQPAISRHLKVLASAGLITRRIAGSAVRAGRVEAMSGPPAEIASRLAASGAQHAYIDGGITVQEFLQAGLIQRITITRVPVLVGQGIPLFGSLPHDVKLRHVATDTYASGLVKSECEVVG